MFSKNFKVKAIWPILTTLTMMFVLAFNAVSAVSVQAQGSTPLAPLLKSGTAKIIPDYYIVVYKPNTPVVTKAETNIRAAVAAQGGEVKFVYGAALNGYSAYLPTKALAAVRADPAVEYVEADGIVQLDQGEVGTEAVQASATWGLDRIDQHNLPLSTTYTYNYNGSGVHAYVIDTGIRSTHSQFGVRATKDYDSIGDGQNGNDCNGHGTHVAGTIGGSTYGVAKNVRLHGVRVLNCAGSGAYSQIIAGVNWVTANHVSPSVANMSLGGGANAALDAAINSMINSGVTLVVAAGNSNDNACSYSPARVPNAITVGATTSTDARSSFSNWGTCLDIFAPGSSITSAWNTNDSATNTINGTSMASPHVAGVAALYLQGHPGATPANVRSTLVGTATSNVVISPGTGSPNKLLYSLLPAAPASKKWTFMVYLAADNNLEGYGIDDFLEMASVGSSSDVNIIVQFDRIAGYDARYGNWTGTKRFYVTNGMTPLPASALSDLGEVNMGLGANLQNFVTWGKLAYPANNYAVILWNHGSGFQPNSEGVSVNGIGWDDTNAGDYLTNVELSTVLNATTNNGANKIALLGFDACLMAMMEVDQHIKNYVTARASSEELEPGDGWPYETILANLKNNPNWTGVQLASAIVSRYYESYGNNQTMSAVQFGPVYNALVAGKFAVFVQALRANMATHRSIIAAALIASQSFDTTDYVDLYDLALQIDNRTANADVSTAAANLRTAITSVVTNNKAGPSWPRAKGTSIFFPKTEVSWATWASAYQTNQWLARDTAWNEFLNEYYNTDITVTLTWGASPTDLDSHMWLPAAYPFHIYYANKGDLTAFPFTKLDVDDVTSYGPENVSIAQPYPGIYKYSVYNYSGNGGGTIKASGAIVRVYRYGVLVKTYQVSTAPGPIDGRWWNVFVYNASSNTFTDQNVLSTASGSAYSADISAEDVKK